MLALALELPCPPHGLLRTQDEREHNLEEWHLAELCSQSILRMHDVADLRLEHVALAGLCSASTHLNRPVEHLSWEVKPH